MMKKILLIIIFCWCGLQVYAQKPGYMGRRVSLFADLSVYPALFNPVSGGQVYYGSGLTNMKFYGFNYRITGGFDVIVSHKSTVGADFNYYRSAINIDTSVNGFADNVIHEFDGFAIGAHYRVFIGKTKAPVGFYYKIETGATFYKLNNTTALGNFYMINSLGRQHVFFDRLILNYGLSVGFVMPTIDPYGNYVSTLEGRLSRTANLRSLSHFGINIYGGIGVLLF